MHHQLAPNSGCRQVAFGRVATIHTFAYMYGLCRRSPQDPEYPKLKAVGVYPVVDGWAHVNLEELAGKGQDYFSPSTLWQVRPCTSVLPSGEAAPLTTGLHECQEIVVEA